MLDEPPTGVPSAGGCYVALDEHGCIVAASTQNVPRRHLAVNVATWIQNGLSVTQMSVARVRKDFGCKAT